MGSSTDLRCVLSLFFSRMVLPSLPCSTVFFCSLGRSRNWSSILPSLIFAWVSVEVPNTTFCASFIIQKSVLFQTIQFSMSIQFKSKTFLFQIIQFSQTVLIQLIQFSISIDFVYTKLNLKTVLFQTIQFSIGTQLTFKNSSISSNYD